MKCGAIAQLLGRASSVYDEVKNNGGPAKYSPSAAHSRALRLRSRPKERKIEANPRLHDRINADLQKRWSPQQISSRLKNEFPGQAEMNICGETIYQTLYLQARGELRTSLKVALRQGRTRRRDHSRATITRGAIPDMVNISQRPPEAADRAVPGFWEGDLIIGKNNASQIATLVERTTRFVMLVKIPYDRRAEWVSYLLAQKMKPLPEIMKRSVTWDQGKEMSHHKKFSIASGLDVYFCDPHSPWQRGTNENTNGLLRQYFPKGTDLSGHSQAELDAVADELNDRPRQTLNWQKPTEAYEAILRESLSG